MEILPKIDFSKAITKKYAFTGNVDIQADMARKL